MNCIAQDDWDHGIGIFLPDAVQAGSDGERAPHGTVTDTAEWNFTFPVWFAARSPEHLVCLDGNGTRQRRRDGERGS